MLLQHLFREALEAFQAGARSVRIILGESRKGWRFGAIEVGASAAPDAESAA
jgi:hypothetical protein